MIYLECLFSIDMDGCAQNKHSGAISRNISCRKKNIIINLTIVDSSFVFLFLFLFESTVWWWSCVDIKLMTMRWLIWSGLGQTIKPKARYLDRNRTLHSDNMAAEWNHCLSTDNAAALLSVTQAEYKLRYALWAHKLILLPYRGGTLWAHSAQSTQKEKMMEIHDDESWISRK